MLDSEDRFRGIYMESPIGIALIDAAGWLTDANEACLKVFGVTEAEKLKRVSLFDNPHLDDKARERLRRGKVARYQATMDFDEVRRLGLLDTLKPGVAYLDVLVSPLGVREGFQPTGYLAHVQDVTEAKKVEAALRESEEWFRSIYW